MVQLGLSKALNSPFSRKYLFNRQTIHFRDAVGTCTNSHDCSYLFMIAPYQKNNNLLHLATMSEDPSTVDFVLGVCSAGGLMTQKEILRLFEEQNSVCVSSHFCSYFFYRMGTPQWKFSTLIQLPPSHSSIN